ncbi:uncharacterized protein CBL_20509 [Carabus blaptoides fortunei]
MILTGEYIVTFVYTLQDTGERFEYPFNIPYEGCIKEFAHIILHHFKLPIYLGDDLQRKLQDFIINSTTEFYDCRTSDSLESVRANNYDVEDTIKFWEKIFREETFEYSERRCVSDEELFAIAYHKLVHSAVLGTMLKLEHNYAKAIKEKIKHRDKQGQMLKDRQTEEMNKAVDSLNSNNSTTEKYINDLVAKHFEHFSMLQGKWSSELDTMKEVQRREYRDWIMQILEENQTNSSLPTPSNSPLNTSSNIPFADNAVTNREYSEAQILEESFTIHLGSQLKQMHNIRILSSDVFDFCSINNTIESPEPTPHLLQTALALYSNDLCGLVLMTNNHVDSYSSMLKEFTQICQYSTEFHFPYCEDQLDKVRDSIKINIAVMDSQGKSSQAIAPQSRRAGSSKNLQTGDVFITRHSNLAQVHVIFHIVTDDSLLSKEINSRHAVLLGLRNILKTACSNDITSLTIPLLLQYDMTEEMTVPWCTKRAELVFKCVKGFMIEMASWGGSDLKNLQFLLPQSISDDVFMSLTAMLPNIFKLSNPLVLKSSNVQKK